MIASIAAKTDAEQAVLGAALIDERCVGRILNATKPEDYGEPLRPVYQAIRTVFQEGRSVDPVAVVQLLGDSYRKTMFALMEGTPTAANVEVYMAQLLRQNQMLRLRELADQFVQNPDSAMIPDIMAAIGEVREGVGHVRRYDGKTRRQLFVERQTGPELQFIDWGFQPLNNAIRAEKGDFIVIGGEPSGGKTALAVQLADLQSRRMKVCFYSLETNQGKITDRQVATRYGIKLSEIKDQNINTSGWERFTEGQDAFDKSFDVVDAAGWNALDVEAHAVSMGYDIVYIDYLQLLRWERGETEYQAVTRASKQLHTFAQRRGITVVALSQFSRSQDNSDPTMHALRSSGQIEADADVILLLYCSKKDNLDPKTRRLKLAKNKEGICGQIPMLFEGTTQRFSLNYAAMNRPETREEPPEQESLT